MKVHEIQIGDKVVIPEFKRTAQGIIIKKIKPGKYKSYLKLVYDNTSLEVPRDTEVEKHD